MGQGLLSGFGENEELTWFWDGQRSTVAGLTSERLSS